MAVTPSTLPLALSLAQDRLDRILEHSDLLHSGTRCRKMRSERLDAVRRVLTVLVRCLDLRHNVVIRLLDEGKRAVPMTAQEIAQLAGIGLRRCERVLAGLRDAGFLETRRQFIRKPDGKPGLLVAAAIRRLTRKFWASMGLWGIFCNCSRYARQNRPEIPLKARIFRVVNGIIHLVGGSHMVTQSDSFEQRQHARKLNMQVAAFNCLFKRYGGKGCNAPDCPQSQREVCKKLRN